MFVDFRLLSWNTFLKTYLIILKAFDRSTATLPSGFITISRLSGSQVASAYNGLEWDLGWSQRWGWITAMKALDPSF